MPLFNGKDLAGWVNVNGDASTWSFRDGMVICTGKPICVLRTERQYENFIVELEWRHMRAGGNAGFFVWSDPITACGQPFTRSIECQVLDGTESENYTSHGDVFAIHGATLTPDRPHPGGWARCLPSERRARSSPEWNHYRITCRDGTLKLAVNGKEVSGGYDINPRKGYLCLESEGSEVHFRNLRIRELPPARQPLRPEQIAAVADGFTALYNGVDLKGWRGAPGTESHWRANDWRLAFDGQGETLWSETSYGDFILIVDCRQIESAKAGQEAAVGEFSVLLRGLQECRVTFPAASGTEWRRAMITARGNRVTAELDGKLVSDSATCSGAARGPIGLGGKGGAVQFANVYLRSLDAAPGK